MLHIGEILTADIANGLGVRVTVFVSGCHIHCPGCFNQDAQNFNYGETYSKRLEQEIIDELAKPQYDGLTILGGEPFEIENQPGVLALVLRVRKDLPDKNIWIFSGYVYDQDLVPGGKRHTMYTDQLLQNIDVLVDGPFVEDKKNLMLNFRGSSNQRIIDMRKTLELGKVCLSPLNN